MNFKIICVIKYVETQSETISKRRHLKCKTKIEFHATIIFASLKVIIYAVKSTVITTTPSKEHPTDFKTTTTHVLRRL